MLSGMQSQNLMPLLCTPGLGFLSVLRGTSNSLPKRNHHQRTPAQQRRNEEASSENSPDENAAFKALDRWAELTLSCVRGSSAAETEAVLRRFLLPLSPSWPSSSSYVSNLTFELNKSDPLLAASPSALWEATFGLNLRNRSRAASHDVRQFRGICTRLVGTDIGVPGLSHGRGLLVATPAVAFTSCRAFTRRESSGISGKRGARTATSNSPILEKFRAKTGAFQLAGMEKHEKIKSMLDDPALSKAEQDKLKVAFAEGFMAADPSKETRKGRIFKIFQQFLVIGLFVAVLMTLLGSFGAGIFRVQVGPASEVHPEDINVTFDDVKGVDEAKQELMDVVEFLKNPEKFSSLGGKLPKGVLLVGPPGTGKTLLARAVAGEAEVPFFHAAGPEFDEILVGQGARRVRDLFRAAKLRAPCVVFIDEIDSVGSKRTTSVLHPYANQTINQLLAEMDGKIFSFSFHANEGVIVLGATNRVDDLDKALTRPGRFDVTVTVPLPDFTGRRDILELYLSRVTKHPEVDMEKLARGTTGFTGADLENVVNQAAVKAAMENADYVTQRHLEWARDKILMGPARKMRLPDEEANLVTAFHEGGHAVVAFYTQDAQALHKVTIIPRGQSLGHTSYIPEKERYHVTRSQLLAMLDTLMGGRAAEELIFGISKVTSGAASDLKEATRIAEHMVKEWGMSDKVGLRYIEDESGALVRVNPLGSSTTEAVDSEITRILQESYERAKKILTKHAKGHYALADALMKYETLDVSEIKAILSGDDFPSPGAPHTACPKPRKKGQGDFESALKDLPGKVLEEAEGRAKKHVLRG
ncbi:unnamed protein product [Cyprideis torosa]|uniref:Uncharacterized protein n=1 Tax=Cyprideis torosa TaxID=163714 RepID=A0A7R8ZNZ6_9CRUS|nr:unnamed protein product [Cyprideis torosa]CAG0887487.1 unnamed protein product [Cyprideis torosa]